MFKLTFEEMKEVQIALIKAENAVQLQITDYRNNGLDILAELAKERLESVKQAIGTITQAKFVP